MDQEEFQTAVLMRFDVIDKRAERHEADYQHFKTAVIGHFKTLEKRMDGLEKRMDVMETKVSALEASIVVLVEQMKAMQLHMNGMQIQINGISQSNTFGRIRFGAEWIVASFVIAALASGVTLGFGRL